MCGIAGYSLDARSRVDRTLTAQSLFAAISERGSDAVGYAYRGLDGRTAVHKQRTGASELLEAIEIPADATQALLHVRDYTKGHPSLAANNHPIRHGEIVGIHNGIIANDDEIFASHGFERAEPDMTVDSEAIFALVEEADDAVHALEELFGSMATAWLDERRPGQVFLARGFARPLWLGRSDDAVAFASTRDALELVERYVGLRLDKHELREGTFLTLESGSVIREASFKLDRSFTERPLPAVRAPGERRSCLERLSALAGRHHAPSPLGATARAR